MFKVKLSLGRFIWIIKASAWARTGSEFLFLWMTGIDLTGGELMALFLHSSDISRLPEQRLWGWGSDGLKWPRRQATGKNELQLGWQLLKMLMNVSTWRPATHFVLCATRAEPLAAMLSDQQGSSRNYSSLLISCLILLYFYQSWVNFRQKKTVRTLDQCNLFGDLRKSEHLSWWVKEKC